MVGTGCSREGLLFESSCAICKRGSSLRGWNGREAGRSNDYFEGWSESMTLRALCLRRSSSRRTVLRIITNETTSDDFSVKAHAHAIRARWKEHDGSHAINIRLRSRRGGTGVVSTEQSRASSRPVNQVMTSTNCNDDIPYLDLPDLSRSLCDQPDHTTVDRIWPNPDLIPFISLPLSAGI